MFVGIDGAGFYHYEVVKEEDFPLMRSLFLGFVDVSHFKQTTAADKSSVGD